ncbi:EcoRII N-terminal effector-binding domain-containing protein [Burkholderia cepacia]|uniref:EcoRII N-terminal effector-binding domain-containing protein n=1 Tax=Burkholderia cepacia TaxID=292 RepID=UPI00264B270C|nr:EcoRII N-terminal effector-binding domain-containing protein [Burkholderia cepacia]MDN7445165.1 EcoRII N-terminal effector-binding domain-containing protein [Burkholderia cepacia]
MTIRTFCKTLSANDVGATGAHQAGILVPKSEQELLDFLPQLDSAVKNPDAWIECVDEAGVHHRFRFVYYNNRFHDPKGTRNEYRITYMTRYFKAAGASEGDTFEISRSEGKAPYKIRVVPHTQVVPDQKTSVANRGLAIEEVSAVMQESEGLKKLMENSSGQGIRIKLTSAWRRVH